MPVPGRLDAWTPGRLDAWTPGRLDAWTKRVVRVRFGGATHQHAVWVWAGAVERA
jgi:hypothetical protein